MKAHVGFSLPQNHKQLYIFQSPCWHHSASLPQLLVLFIIHLIFPPLLRLCFHSCYSLSPHSLSIPCYPLALSICSVPSLALAVSCCPHHSLLLSHFPTPDHVQSVSLSLCSGLFQTPMNIFLAHNKNLMERSYQQFLYCTPQHTLITLLHVKCMLPLDRLEG